MPEQIDQTREFLTTPQAAERSKLSKVYLTILLKRGTLEGTRLGRDWLIYADSLEQFLAVPHKPGPKGPRKKSRSNPHKTSSMDSQAKKSSAEC